MRTINRAIDDTAEDPIDPEVPIIDPHHHMGKWDDVLGGPVSYLIDEFLEDIAGGHNIVKTVYVEAMSMYRKDGPEAMRPVGETEFANGIAAMSASGRYGPTAVAAGIVSFADLSLGTAVEPVLKAHIAAGGQRLRGIRHATAWREDQASYMNSPKHLMLDPKFREGFACLLKYGLSFDAWLLYPQMRELADLARVFPDTTIVLDHGGGPLGDGTYAGRRDEVFQDWQRGISVLAACDNVVVKLGGLAMPQCGFGWHERNRPPTSVELAEATAPYFLFCLEQFGVHSGYV